MLSSLYKQKHQAEKVRDFIEDLAQKKENLSALQRFKQYRGEFLKITSLLEVRAT